MKQLPLLTFALMAFSSVQAHMLWLEQGPNQTTRAYFGEYAENAKETQQGPLKAFANAKAIQGEKQYSASAFPDYWQYPTQGTMDIRVNHDLVHGDMLAQFRAKYGRTGTQAISELDIVPVKANANQFIVYFQGKPLAKQQVVIFAPNRWSKTYYSNDKGEFSVETPWKGQYVIEAGKPVEEAGEYQQKAYKTRYLVATLSFNLN